MRAFATIGEGTEMRVFTVLLLCACICTGVEPGTPSKTSVVTAAMRAVGSKFPDSAFRNPDYLAIRFIGPAERALLDDWPVEVIDLDFDDAVKRVPPGRVVGMFLRTRFMDDALQESLVDGVRQVVLLGAGFDTRGYRFEKQLGGVRFIEVDYGPTQEYKKRRVMEVLGRVPDDVQYVSMDFTKDDLLPRLKKGGYSESVKTLFIWEGVTMYISEAAVRATLTFVRDHSPAGSRIVFDYFLARMSLVNKITTPNARWGEPYIFGFPGEDAATFVRGAGLEVISDQKFYQLAKRYAMKADGTFPLPGTPTDSDPPDSRGKTDGICYARVPARDGRK
jgi:methyltransferase (TIGR00027 family)